MALFYRKPRVETSAPLYSIGLQKSLLIVGLGNIGKKYDGTRHNIGFTALDALAKTLEFPEWVEKKDHQCLYTSSTIADSHIYLVKPTTLMNRSGQSVGAVMNYYKMTPDRVVVVHDELDIPFGQIRLRVGGSAAGNNGIKSLIEHIGEEFGRVRIGIRNEIAEKADGKDFVLGKFSKAEQELLPALTRETNAILSELIHGQPLTPDTRSFIV
ncbi:MAG: aminoacyl-tRNA hydrolase [Candidatus Saccharibacteria bacterium]|nr:aminoacyl-tRNA hydrolase [Candidatus Saccharibacteria bacterium]